ncbi:hypothetical protein BS78_03G216300 [Paspalum vaginatum]|nr:hypothetical protein BS78_03G216300 [Paspalum vaginatum]
MAGSSDSEDRGRRRSLAGLYGDEPEERGYRYDEETEDDHNIHGDSARANNGDARARPPPSSVAATKNGNGSSYPAADPVLGCDSCGEEFRSREAVRDHMKVHQEAEQGIGKENRGAKRDAPDLPSYWGVTCKREWPGAARDASPSSAQESDQFIVAAGPEIVLEPMPNPSSATSVPVASATATDSDFVESSGAQPVDNDNDAVETANPEADVVHLQAAPPSPPAAGNPASPPPVHQQEQPAAAPPPRGGWQNPDGYKCNKCDMRFPTYQALGGHKKKHYTGQAQQQQQPNAAPPRPRGGRQNPDGYTCKKCGIHFPTQQALGGHTADHNRKERAAAGLQDGAGPQKAYACRVCGKEYPTGRKLGGHMRKHYTGPRISNKPRLVLAIPPQPLPPPGTTTAAHAPSVKAEEASSAPSPAAAGSPLGIDIKEEKPEQTPPAAHQGSSASETEADSPDTGTGEKQ